MNRQKVLTEWVDLLNSCDRLVSMLENMDENHKDFDHYKDEAHFINARIAAFEDAYPWLAKVSQILDEE